MISNGQRSCRHGVVRSVRYDVPELGGRLTRFCSRVSVLSIQCMKVFNEEEGYVESDQALYILLARPSTPSRTMYERHDHNIRCFYDLTDDYRIHLDRKEGLV